MAAFQITCTVIPELQDDEQLARFVIIAPEDRMVWVAAWKPAANNGPGRKNSGNTVAGIGPGGPDSGLKAQDGADCDILRLSDGQLDCRSRNLGKCTGHPVSVVASNSLPEGAVEIGEDDCFLNVLECWMLEEAMD